MDKSLEVEESQYPNKENYNMDNLNCKTSNIPAKQFNITSVEVEVELSKFGNNGEPIKGSATYTASTSANRQYKRVLPIEASNLIALSNTIDQARINFIKDIKRKINTIEERLSLLLIRDEDTNTMTVQLKCLVTSKIYVSITREIHNELQTIAELVKAAYVELAVNYKM